MTLLTAFVLSVFAALAVGYVGLRFLEWLEERYA